MEGPIFGTLPTYTQDTVACNALMKATAEQQTQKCFLSDNDQSIMAPQSRGLDKQLIFHLYLVGTNPTEQTSCFIQVFSHYIQARADIDLEWNNWPRRIAQMDLNTVSLFFNIC